MATYEEVKDIPNQPEKYLIDVRNPSELEETAVLPGSINIPAPNLDEALKLSDEEFNAKYNRKKPSKDAEIIFSCKAGGRAQRASDLAKGLGFVNSKPYLGSWTEWAEKEGL